MRIELVVGRTSGLLQLLSRVIYESPGIWSEQSWAVADPGFGQGRGQPAKEGLTWPKRAKEGLTGPSGCGPPRDLRAREGHLRFQTHIGPIMSSEGPSGCSEGLFRRSEGPLMSSEGPSGGQWIQFRGHQSTCWSLQTIHSFTLRVSSGAKRAPSRLKGGSMAPWPPLDPPLVVSPWHIIPKSH